MDPNATLASIRELTREATNARLSADDSEILAELVVSLDDWLSRGGFLPTDWMKK